MTGRPPTLTRGAAYVPVHTMHDLLVETGQTPKLPVIICTGCAHPIPAPRGGAALQCRDCGRKMQIVSISPAGEKGKAGNQNG